MHAVYLATIVVLLVVLVVVAARASRARRVLADLEERFGAKDGVRASLPRKGGEPLRRAAPQDLLRPRTYDEYRQEVDELLARAQALEEFGPKTQLADACRTALEGGKRLRAVILLEVARAAAARRGAAVDAGEAALFVEYLHAASLVVDDLPEFDNDLVRRGRPSLHAAAGGRVALMAALALVSAAFQNVCRQIDWLRDNCPEIDNADRIGTRICGDVSRALGALGAAGGEYMDTSSVEDLYREHGPGAVADLTYRKTATFFEIAVATGWLVAGGAPEQAEAVRGAGRLVGTAFQIADDLGDQALDAARAAAGKPGWNYAEVYGREAAARDLERNLDGARRLLAQNGLWTALWDEIYGQVRKMAEPESASGGGGAAA